MASDPPAPARRPGGDGPARRRAARPPRPIRPPGCAADTGGPATPATSTTSKPGRRRPGWLRPRPARDDRAAPRSRRPAARRRSAGRFGPRRTTSSREKTTRTGRPYRSASSRAAAGAGDASLAPEGPPIGGGVGGLAAGQAPRRVRLQVGRLHPGGLEDEVPVARRHLERVAQLPAAAPALDLARTRPGPRPGSRPPPSHRRRSGTATRQSGGAVSSAKPPRPRTTSGPVRCAGATLEGRPAFGAGRARRRGAGACDAGPDRTAAATIVRHPVQRHRWASKADSTWLGRRVRGRAQPGGTGCPGCRSRTGWRRGDEGVDQPGRHLRVEPVDGRHRPARDPPHRRHARHPGRAVDEDRAAPTLALRAAAVLDRPDAQVLPQGVQERDPPRAATSTGRPSRVKATRQLS